MALPIIVIAIFLFQILKSFSSNELLECQPKHFKLDGMETCHSWISCNDLEEVTTIKRLGTGAVKDVFLAKWKEFLVVLSIPFNSEYLEDFQNGVEILKSLSPSNYTVQFLGYCNEKQVLFTEYHSDGTAEYFFSKKPPENNDVISSLGFCYQYSMILNYLHNGPAGKRVFCDSNSLSKLLSQLLITSNKQLILNDVDALAQVMNGSGIKCGHKELKGSFVAPEQLWTKNGNFNDDLLPGYNEKTDIWKAAAVCEFFLKRAKGGEVVRYRLFDLHSECRNIDPVLRPTAKQLVKEYNIVMEEFNIHSEL